MKWRTAWLIIGALAIVCLALIFSVVHPFSLDDREGPDAAQTLFSAGEPDEYAFEATYVRDGELQREERAVVTADGAALVTYSNSMLTTERYQPAGVSSHYFVRHATADEHAIEEAIPLEDIEAAEDRTVLSVDRDAEVVLLRVNRSIVDTKLAGPGGLLVPSGLGRMTYERAGEAGSKTIYEPENGWYDALRVYRVTGASGEVVVDGDSNTVLSADVSWTETRPADSYARYALVRLFGEESIHQSLEYELETDDVVLDEPDWVETARE